MAKTTPYKNVMLRLNPQVHEQITAVAKAEKRSVTAQIELILERFLEAVDSGIEPAQVFPKGEAALAIAS